LYDRRWYLTFGSSSADAHPSRKLWLRADEITHFTDEAYTPADEPRSGLQCRSVIDFSANRLLESVKSYWIQYA
jgi:hypothetical protein